MRVARGTLSGLGTYQGPVPVVLIDGTVIQDPNSQAPTDAECIPYRCGADASNLGARLWCAYYGRGGNQPCLDVCDQYSSEGASTCAISIVAPEPASTAVANAHVSKAVQAAAPPGAPAVLTPQSIVQPLPDITAVFAPIPVSNCSGWQSVNGWVQDNPLLAGALLFGAYLLAARGKRK